MATGSYQLPKLAIIGVCRLSLLMLRHLPPSGFPFVRRWSPFIFFSNLTLLSLQECSILFTCYEADSVTPCLLLQLESYGKSQLPYLADFNEPTVTLSGISLDDDIIVNAVFQLMDACWNTYASTARASFTQLFSLQDQYLFSIPPMAITQAVSLRQQLRLISVINMASTSLLLTISFDAKSNFYAYRAGNSGTQELNNQSKVLRHIAKSKTMDAQESMSTITARAGRYQMIHKVCGRGVNGSVCCFYFFLLRINPSFFLKLVFFYFLRAKYLIFLLIGSF